MEEAVKSLHLEGNSGLKGGGYHRSESGAEGDLRPRLCGPISTRTGQELVIGNLR